jgi:hypothetical protein
VANTEYSSASTSSSSQRGGDRGVIRIPASTRNVAKVAGRGKRKDADDERRGNSTRQLFDPRNPGKPLLVHISNRPRCAFILQFVIVRCTQHEDNDRTSLINVVKTYSFSPIFPTTRYYFPRCPIGCLRLRTFLSFSNKFDCCHKLEVLNLFFPFPLNRFFFFRQ